MGEQKLYIKQELKCLGELKSLGNDFQNLRIELQNEDHATIEMKTELDISHEIINVLENFIVTMGKEVCVLKDDLKNKGEDLNNKETQVLELMNNLRSKENEMERFIQTLKNTIQGNNDNVKDMKFTFDD